MQATSPPGVGVVDVTVTVPVGGTSVVHPGDRFGYESGPPEFGRCLQSPPSNEGSQFGFTTETCAALNKGANLAPFEWEPGLGNPRFTLSSAKVALQAAVSKAKLTCTSAQGSGEVGSTPTALQNVVMRFAGCVQSGKKCTSAGRSEGEVETSTLEGTLGFENREKKKVALALFPAGHSGPFLAYTCVGGASSTISGGVIGVTISDKMAATNPLKYAATEGKQKIQHFEGGGSEVLTNQLSEAVGLSVTLTLKLTNEERFELSALY